MNNPLLAFRIWRLIRQFRTSDGERENWLREELSNIGPPVFPYLVRGLADKDERVRFNCVILLKPFRDERALHALRSAMADEDASVRGHAAHAISMEAAKIRGRLAEVILFGALDDRDWKVRASAAAAIGNVGGMLASVILTRALSDENKEVRANAICALGTMGEKSATQLINFRYPPATAALALALKDGDLEIRCAAAEALGKISGPSAASAILDSLRDCLEGGSNLEYSEFYKQLCGALDKLAPDTLDDLRLLHKVILLTRRLAQKDMGWEKELGKFISVYKGWPAVLSQASMNAHEGMQAPPRRFRNPPEKPGKHNISAQSKIAIGGAKR